jgi:hypothetical protein
MNITSKKVTTQVREAMVRAEHPSGVTLDEVAAFLRAASEAGIPGDTTIETNGFLFAQPTPFIRVSATVEEEL